MRVRYTQIVASAGLAAGLAFGQNAVLGGPDKRPAKINKPRTRTALAAVLALASSPTGFTVTDLTTKARAMTGQAPSDYTVRKAAYDLKKLRVRA